MLVRTVRFTCVAALLAVTTAAAAGPKPLVNKDRDDIAVKGYDVVAYTEGAPAKGLSQFSARWQDATYLFATAANRDRFQKEPLRYAPQFGGYCAWAVSRGYTADIDPEVFRIVGGKLYLIYSKSVQRRWEQDVTGNITKAQANWPAVLDK
jgi:hypothetical protein